MTQLSEFEKRITALEKQSRVAAKSVTATSNAVQGPGSLGVRVVYTALSVVIDPGEWEVYAQATLSSQAAADSKCIGIYNATAATYIANTNGPAHDVSATGVNTSHYTLAVVTVTVTTTLQIVAFQNGTSQITVGYAGSLSPTQRITAVQIG